MTVQATGPRANAPETMISCFLDESNYLTKIDVVGMPIQKLHRYIGKKFGLMLCNQTSHLSTFIPIEFILINNIEDVHDNLTRHFTQCDDIEFQLDKDVHSLNLDHFSLLRHFQKELIQKTDRQTQLYKELRDTHLYGDAMERAASESSVGLKKRELKRISTLIKKKIDPLIQHLKKQKWNNECPLCSTHVSNRYVQTAYRLVCNDCFEQINS